MTDPTDLQSAPRIGLALGGGGPLGGIYEIGALRALDEALDGLDFNDIDVYVGVNSGSFVAANLANQMTTRNCAGFSFAMKPRCTHSIPRFSIGRLSGRLAGDCCPFPALCPPRFSVSLTTPTIRACWRR